MKDTQTTQTPAPDAPPQESSAGRGFQGNGSPFIAGHPRFGGRTKGTPQRRTKQAREIADELGWHPVRFLVSVANGFMPNRDGTETAVDVATRLDAAKALIPYLLPKLNAITVTGANGGPIAHSTLDVTKIMMNPALSAAAQELALMVVEQEVEALDKETPLTPVAFQ